MGTALKEVSIGWAALGKIINRIIEKVNANCPVEGSGIRITDGKNGKIIELSSSANAQNATAQASSSAGPDAKINGLIWRGVKWGQVSVIDPATCAQSSITVLQQTGNQNDSVNITFSDYVLWATPVSQ